MYSREEGQQDNIETHWLDDAPGDVFMNDMESVPQKKRVSHVLDNSEHTDIHRTLKGHYHRELDRQSDARMEQETDEAIYDHIHWTQEEKAVLEDRGQVPLVYNVTATAVNWVLGSQRRAPMDYSILPRKKAGLKHAQRKTELMKYLSDVNNTAMCVSRAFAEAVKSGLSWLETGVQNPEDGEVVYERFESWRNILADSTAQELDFTDARYIFRTKWLDLDRAIAMFPEREDVLRVSVENVYEAHRGGTHGSGDSAMDTQEAEHFNSSSGYADATYAPRQRVRLIEAWYKTPKKSQFMRRGDFNGQLYDEYSEGHRMEVEAKRSEIVTRTKERMMVAIMTDKGLLANEPSPYRHNEYPFTPVWAYRRASDGMPYGLIRGVRDIQLDVNKRAAKMLWHLSAQRTTVSRDAVQDHAQTRDEVNRPDAYIIYEEGKQPPKIDNDFQLAASHGELMQADIALIERQSGITDSNKGEAPVGRSGKAIEALQDQGQMTTNVFFEHLRYARRLHGEKLLCNIEQFMDEEKEFRITNSRGQPEYISINDDNPDDDNWITRTKADFIVSEQAFHETMRQANVEKLLTLAQTVAQGNPEMLVGILDLLVETMDVPKQEEIVKRIRAITGLADPDADPEEDANDPDVQDAKAAKAAHAQMQGRIMDAEVVEKEGKAKEAQARARKVLAEATKIEGDATTREVENLKRSIEAAMQLIGTEGVAAVADRVMAEAERKAMQTAPQPQATLAPPAPETSQSQPQPVMADQLEGDYQ